MQSSVLANTKSIQSSASNSTYTNPLKQGNHPESRLNYHVLQMNAVHKLLNMLKHSTADLAQAGQTKLKIAKNNGQCNKLFTQTIVHRAHNL